MQLHSKGLMLSTRALVADGNGSRSSLPNRRQKHRNKDYFDQNNTVLIPGM